MYNTLTVNCCSYGSRYGASLWYNVGHNYGTTMVQLLYNYCTIMVQLWYSYSKLLLYSYGTAEQDNNTILSMLYIILYVITNASSSSLY